MSHCYRGHGLTIVSEIELSLPVVAQRSAVPDLILSVAPNDPGPASELPAEQLASLVDEQGKVLYVLARDAQRTVLSYPGLCDFVGDRDFRRVVARRHPDTDPGLVAVLASGAVLAVHLKLAGRLVLHASSVQIGIGAVAFVGASGMGKSTISALLCTAGCTLVSDDVLVVTPGPVTGWQCWGGSTESRLRQSARQLAAGAAPELTRPTADGRLALRATLSDDGPIPLIACVVPLPSRDLPRLSLSRLTPTRALQRMLQFPRLVGWTEPGGLARDFEALADLVRDVPVYEARIPWGPPFSSELAPEMISAITSDTSAYVLENVAGS